MRRSPYGDNRCHSQERTTSEIGRSCLAEAQRCSQVSGQSPHRRVRDHPRRWTSSPLIRRAASALPAAPRPASRASASARAKARRSPLQSAPSRDPQCPSNLSLEIPRPTSHRKPPAFAALLFSLRPSRPRAGSLQLPSTVYSTCGRCSPGAVDGRPRAGSGVRTC